MSNISDNISQLSEQVRAYVESIIDFHKLNLFKTVAAGATATIKSLAVGVFLMLFTVFGSIAVALAIGGWLGFLIVGLFYLVLGVLTAAFALPFIRKQVLHTLSIFWYEDGPSMHEDALEDKTNPIAADATGPSPEIHAVIYDYPLPKKEEVVIVDESMEMDREEFLEEEFIDANEPLIDTTDAERAPKEEIHQL